MVGEQVRPIEVIAAETYYTPGRVGWWLEHWRLLMELAAPSAPAVNYDRVSQVPEGMRPTDPMRYKDILVDLEKARLALKNPSGEQIVADAMTTEPLDWSPKHDYLMVVAQRLGVSLHDAWRAWDSAREKIARALGWRE